MSLKIQQFDYLDSAQLFARVVDEPWSQFLDSGVIAQQFPVSKHADYDVLAIRPVLTMVTQGLDTQINDSFVSRTCSADPLALLKSELANFESQSSFNQTLWREENGSNDQPFLPGAIGYCSYDLSRRFEKLPSLAQNKEQLPEMAMGIYSVIVVVDHKHQEVNLISLGSNTQVSKLTELWIKLINLQLSCENPCDPQAKTSAPLIAAQLQENTDWIEYQKKFDKIRQYTIDGDCYQVNFTKQFKSEVNGDPWLTYQSLREASPAPYGAYQNFPFAQVLSNSPESFIRCHNGQVATSPIKGTRPRDHLNAENDQKIARELEQSEKDKSENLMIVDLMRNDLSRSCELGSVKVPSLFALHSFANVHHLISTVTGVLKPNIHVLDLLRSSFPGGSITGAPKIRAMQIIEELEPDRRGLYCGSIVHVGVNGSLETSITIRTIVVKDGVARYSAGGGLVIDSIVEDEYQEIEHKARMMNQALMGRN